MARCIKLAWCLRLTYHCLIIVSWSHLILLWKLSIKLQGLTVWQLHIPPGPTQAGFLSSLEVPNVYSVPLIFFTSRSWGLLGWGSLFRIQMHVLEGIWVNTCRSCWALSSLFCPGRKQFSGIIPPFLVNNGWMSALLYACSEFMLWLLKCIHVCTNDYEWAGEASGKDKLGHLETVC